METCDLISNVNLGDYTKGKVDENYISRSHQDTLMEVNITVRKSAMFSMTPKEVSLKINEFNGWKMLLVNELLI